MAAPAFWGNEFVVNTEIDDHQTEPSITALSDGRFVAVWMTDSENPPIKAQIFNADGTKAGDEFFVAESGLGFVGQPEVVGLPGGGFVVTWTNEAAIPYTNGGVQARIFDAEAEPVTDQFQVSTTLPGVQRYATVATLEGGGFVVTWTDSSATGDDTAGMAVRGQIYTDEGIAVGGEFLVNQVTAGDQYSSSVTGLADGRFVVSWVSASVSDSRIEARVFEADGTPAGDEFLVSVPTVEGVALPQIVALADGGFVAVWTDYDPLDGDGDMSAIVGHRYDASGAMLGGTFVINTTVADDQSYPTIAALPDGGFVVAWQDASATGDDTDENAIRAQVFDAAGNKLGDEFLVNGATTRDQDAPTITVLADGRFVIAWRDESETLTDTDLDAIHGRIFDPRTGAVSLAGSTGDDDLIGTDFADTLAGRGGSDTLAGAGGDDRINGEEGDDALSGGIGGDAIDGGIGKDEIAGDAGADTLLGGADDDTVRGGADNDWINGGTGNDLLSGDGGSDTLVGDIGNDTLDGGGGGDDLRGGKGNDAYVVDSRFDTVTELAGKGEGTDTVMSAAFSINLGRYANVERATLTGGLDLDIVGSAVADVLTGNAGDNDITGGRGRDVATGGLGADTFVFTHKLDSKTAASARDVVADFNRGQGDKIDLSAIDAIKGGADDAFTFIGGAGFHKVKGELRVVASGPNAVVHGDINGDGKADFSILVKSAGLLIDTDFNL